jgi:pimeloyl-ACP methyl ester carboxylesterase
MKASESLFVPVRGLRYHCRIWGDESAPVLFMLHGWMDVSASFQFLVDAMRGRWRVIAPDWRGFGQSEWTNAGAYWFPDYFADLEALLEHFQPGAPATLIGHSMGGNIAAMYAGIRPDRVAKLLDLEGLGALRKSAGEGARALRALARGARRGQARIPRLRQLRGARRAAARQQSASERGALAVSRALLGQGEGRRPRRARERSRAQARQPRALSHRSDGVLAQGHGAQPGWKARSRRRRVSRCAERRSRRAQKMPSV